MIFSRSITGGSISRLLDPPPAGFLDIFWAWGPSRTDSIPLPFELRTARVGEKWWPGSQALSSIGPQEPGNEVGMIYLQVWWWMLPDTLLPRLTERCLPLLPQLQRSAGRFPPHVNTRPLRKVTREGRERHVPRRGKPRTGHQRRSPINVNTSCEHQTTAKSHQGGEGEARTKMWETPHGSSEEKSDSGRKINVNTSRGIIL